MIGIYKITNKENGKVYIGQSIDIDRRIAEHKKEHFVNIDDYIQVLGADKFDFEIVEECTKEELDLKEKQYIQEYNSQNCGYNYQVGGYNNSIGEGNGRALLTEDQVKFIRLSYNNHCQPREIYDEYFKDIITLSQFQSVWQGRSWSNVMPEVFTEENRKFYKSGFGEQNAALTKEEVLKYRKLYVDKPAKEVYQTFVTDCPEKQNSLNERSFIRILQGDVRKDSFYNKIPIYKKSLKRWELNGEPLQTILGSEE